MSSLIKIEKWLLSIFVLWYLPYHSRVITLPQVTNHIVASLLKYRCGYLLEGIEVVVEVKFEKCWLINVAALFLLLLLALSRFGWPHVDVKFWIWCHGSSPLIVALPTFVPKSCNKTVMDEDREQEALAFRVVNNMLEELILIALKSPGIVILFINKYLIAFTDAFGHAAKVNLSKEPKTIVGDVFYMESKSGTVTKMVRNDSFFTKFALEAAASVPHFKLMLLYSNLADKVLFEDGSIVMNMDSPHVGPRAKPQRSPSIRQPNNTFAWDPG